MFIYTHNVDTRVQWNVIVSTINGHNLDTGYTFLTYMYMLIHRSVASQSDVYKAQHFQVDCNALLIYMYMYTLALVNSN